MFLIIYETCVDIAIICATQIRWYVSFSWKSEVWISDLAVLNHTHMLRSKKHDSVRDTHFSRSITD